MSVPTVTTAANAAMSAGHGPNAVDFNPSRIIRRAIDHRQSWLGRLICGWPSPDPLVRLRTRSIRYYLRRAAAPSTHQRRKAKQGVPPRPDSVPDLYRCRWNAALSLAFLALSIAFIVCYCLMSTFRAWLGLFEGLACSVAVATLLVAATVLVISSARVWRIHRNARRYAEFVRAMVDEKGNFNVKAEGDHDYADYIKAFGIKSLVIF